MSKELKALIDLVERADLIMLVCGDKKIGLDRDLQTVIVEALKDVTEIEVGIVSDDLLRRVNGWSHVRLCKDHSRGFPPARRAVAVRQVETGLLLIGALACWALTWWWAWYITH